MPGKNTVRSILKADSRTVFYITCIAFAVIFSFAGMICDDIGAMRVEGGTIADYWQKSVDMYSTWTSRIFVNFIIFLFTDNQYIFLWGIFMGISLYVLMYSFSKLFTSEENGRQCNTVIACLVLLFPFQYMNSAGWISTMTTYLSPVAFGFLSLLPLKKVYNQKAIAWYEYIIYALALIYGANNEQMMVVILGCYLAGFLYLLYRKRFHAFVLIQLLLAVADCLLVLLCPGHDLRKQGEIISWYKTWDMFNRIDKIDLGYSTTMQNILFGSHIFMIAICCLFTYMIWLKYKRAGYMMIAAIPAVLLVLFGPLRSITASMFPNITGLTDDIERNGLVTVVNRGNLQAFGRYMIWAALIIMLCITMILLQNHVKMLIASFVLLGTGAASRLVMGFSPTIYASRERTFTVMYFCIIAVACYAYSNNVEQGYIEGDASRKVDLAAVILIVCAMINILFLVAEG